jgi:HPt (histidine-containing phosphotransfer) domain-containing protein
MLQESDTHPTSEPGIQGPAPSFHDAELSARCMGNHVLMKRVLLSFSESFGRDCDHLQKDLGALDFESVRKLAHRMRGASGNVAAKRLHAICNELERLALSEDPVQLASLLANLLDEWQNFQHVTESFMKA